VIERIIGFADQRFGAVIDIEQDCIERRRLRLNHLDNIGTADAGARIVKTVAEQAGHRTPGPRDHGRHQLGHHDPRISSEHRQRGTQRKSHAQAADQQLRTLHRFDPLAGKRGQRLFGAAEAAVHQFARTEHHGEFGTSLHQAKFDVCAGNGCGIDLQPGNHAMLLRYPSIWVSPQIEIACPEMVRPRGLHINKIWSAICSGVT